MSWTQPPPAQPYLHVAGESALFAVRRVWCVGRNYAAHAREMGSDPDREPPFFFAKPADAVVPAGTDGVVTVPYPPQTANLHHEVELVVALAVGGRNIPADRALAHVFGYAVGLDLTRRDLQNASKKVGQPWEMGKAFDASAPTGELVRAADWTGAAGEISLTVNGTLRQTGALADLIWPVADVVAHLSRFVALAPGDIIFTGTPEGVAPLVPGDVAVACLSGVPSLTTHIGPPAAGPDAA